MRRLFGVLHLRVAAGSKLKFVESRERGGGGCRQFMSKVTCQFCRCGGADCCCGKPDPFLGVEIHRGGLEGEAPLVWRAATSSTISNNASPTFDYDCSLLLDNFDPLDPEYKRDWSVLVKVFDDDFGSEAVSDLLGLAKISFESFAKTPLQKAKRRKLTVGMVDTKQVGHIDIGWTFISLLDGADPEVPMTHFAAVQNNLIDLYHDSHQVGDMPNVPIAGDDEYEARGAWKDLHYAISHAKEFVFMVGWSINVDISLKRKLNGKQYPTVGELLLEKSREGVKVCILIWDDFSSGKMNQEGLMGTSDEKTFQFFKGTDVMCHRVPRETTATGWLAQTFHKAVFTHHQKVVVCDVHSEYDANSRTVQAFFGGLDITNGRFDTPEHNMFSHLDTLWAGDFYNGCVAQAGPDCGPREPWHDIHAVVKGPAAWQFLQNFQERCARQAADMLPVVVDHVGQLEDSGRVVKEEYRDCSSFAVQCLRSIDYGSAVLNKSPFTRQFAKLPNAVDFSIQQAYAYQIMRAKRYVYVENQYFLGSAQIWPDQSLRTVPCHNVVPQTLAFRICAAIEAGEDFHVYVNVPLFPEGIPDQAAPQEIMHYQYQTVWGIHKTVTDCLRRHGSSRQSSDYFSMFFLGKRELRAPDEPTIEEIAEHRKQNKIKFSDQMRRILEMRRHQIYIHSKMLIVDDEYLLVGSANVNERSMNGSRDSEIAGGLWQPDFRAKRGSGGVVLPRGYVHGFRVSLFTEHLGDSSFADLGDPSTAQTINELARRNFDAFMAEEVQTLPHGHLCTYPYVFEDDKLTHHPSCKNVPDTQASLIGATSSLMVDLLTT